MLNGYKILTVTHRQTPLHKIGDFIVDYENEGQLKNELVSIKENWHLDELVYLSSCNRVVYFFYTEKPLTSSFKFDFFSFESISSPDICGMEKSTTSTDK